LWRPLRNFSWAAHLPREERLRAVGEQGAGDRHVVTDDVLEEESGPLDVRHAPDPGGDLELRPHRTRHAAELALRLEPSEELAQVAIRHPLLPGCLRAKPPAITCSIVVHVRRA
jgi:hypothetical protein